jgi:hypothetical protein
MTMFSDGAKNAARGSSQSGGHAAPAAMEGLEQAAEPGAGGGVSMLEGITS